MSCRQRDRVKPSKRIMDFLGNPSVAKVFEMKRRVSNEAHYFIEFVRFRELENGVLFSENRAEEQGADMYRRAFCRSFSDGKLGDL